MDIDADRDIDIDSDLGVLEFDSIHHWFRGELFSDRGRWAIFRNRRIHTGRGHWWNKPEADIPTDVEEGSSVVLTVEESNFPLSGLSYSELQAKLEDVGSLLPPTVVESPVYIKWLSYFIKKDYSFGDVYAWVQAISSITGMLDVGADKFDIMCNEMLKNGPDAEYNCSEDLDGVVGTQPQRMIVEDNFGTKLVGDAGCRLPRRVWDVCANRVVPATWFQHIDHSIIEKMSEVIPVSHAWVAWEEMEFVMTPVNHYLWPVPLPRGVEIEDIRMELVWNSARYAWLDVLCLRQPAYPGNSDALSHNYTVPDTVVEARERMRLEEWKTDVPLIGEVYSNFSNVLVYLSGLGRPFCAGEWDSPRHWLRRAWTLQEMRPVCTIAGTRGIRQAHCDLNPLKCEIDDVGTTVGSGLQTLYVDGFFVDLNAAFVQLRKRYSTNPVDKIAALLYLPGTDMVALQRRILPIYDPDEDPKSAWVHFVRATSFLRFCDPFPTTKKSLLALELLRHFPNPSSSCWFPSWDQFQNPSLQEEQLPDEQVIEMVPSLYINGGMIYRGVTLSPSPDGSGDYIAEMASLGGQGDASGSPISVLLSANSPGCSERTLPPPIIPGYQYVLVDVTPSLNHLYIEGFTHDYWPCPCYEDSSSALSNSSDSCDNTTDDTLPPALAVWDQHVLIPKSDRHVFILCKELSPWPGIQINDDPQNAASFPEDVYHYRLRRVTSLFWTSKGEPVTEPSSQWLPFQPTMSTQVFGRERAEADIKSRKYYRVKSWPGGVRVWLQ